MSAPFTYNNTPIANHFPGDDQPQMQTNFISIKDLIAVDHVSFNEAPGANQGMHEQVTFSSNNVPISYTNPILYTNIKTSTPVANNVAQLLISTGSAAASLNQYVFGRNGSVLLFGGVILKWFSATITGNQTITFSSAGIGNFPNNAWGAIVNNINGVSTLGYSSLTTSQIVFINSGSNSSIFAMLIGN